MFLLLPFSFYESFMRIFRRYVNFVFSCLVCGYSQKLLRIVKEPLERKFRATFFILF